MDTLATPAFHSNTELESDARYNTIIMFAHAHKVHNDTGSNLAAEKSFG